MVSMIHVCVFFLCFLSTCACWETSLETCSIGQNETCVKLRFQPDEFIQVFSSTFMLSDGSIPVWGRGQNSDLLDSTVIKNVLSMLGDVGIQVDDLGTYVLMRERDLLKMGMLATLGNFISLGQSTSVGFHESVGTVVMDVYTGGLVIVPPYSVMRQYLMETLLVISVVAIARLSLVRQVTIIPKNCS